MSEKEAIEAEAFYRYGFKGRDMIAVRAPFAMAADSEIVGRSLRVGGADYRVRAVSRQITGPVQKGEPIGVEVEAV